MLQFPHTQRSKKERRDPFTFFFFFFFFFFYYYLFSSFLVVEKGRDGKRSRHVGTYPLLVADRALFDQQSLLPLLLLLLFFLLLSSLNLGLYHYRLVLCVFFLQCDRRKHRSRTFAASQLPPPLPTAHFPHLLLPIYQFN